MLEQYVAENKVSISMLRGIKAAFGQRSHLCNWLSELRTAGLIEYRSGAIALPPSGDAT